MEGWMQILVFVVLAVIYALGSIIKAKSNKIEQEKDEEHLAPKGPRKPPESLRRLQKESLRQARAPAGPAPSTGYERQIQPVRRKVVRPEPVVRKPFTKKKEPTPLPAIEMPEVSELPLLGPQVEHGIEELPEFTTETLEKLEAKPLGLAAKRPVVKDVSRPVLDYTDADELTRAILHYEILGKPLSLRDPSQRIIGF